MRTLTRRRTPVARRPIVETLQQRLLLAAVAARPADAFVDSIGVNTHFSWASPSPYSFAATLPSLGNSGIRHIRDNLKSPGFARVSSLYDNYGIRTDVVVDNFDVPIADQVNALANPWAASIEGANEPDLNNRTYAGLTDGTGAGGTNTYAATKRFQADLFAAINADSRTANKPVRAPAVGYSVRAPLLAGADYDEATAHIYPPGTNPDYWRTDAAYLPATSVMNDGATKPLIVTETGYTTVNTGDFRVDDATQGKYIPRLLAEYFNRGIARTYLYDFADDGNDPANKENNFGLIEYGGATKPAYTNLKNMIALLGESTWNTATKQRTTPTFAPGTLDFTLAGDTANVHQLLLQKSNGDFYLMLWNEALSFDGTAPIAVPAKNVHLEINTPLSAASRYTLGSTAVQGTYASPQAIDLSVPDSIVMLRLTPRVAAAPTTTLPVVSVRATDRVAGENAADPGAFTFTRTGSTAATLVVSYAVAGTAQNGVDYASLGGTVTIPAGAASTIVSVSPTADSIAVAEADESVTVTVIDQPSYDVGDQRSDDVLIANAAPDLIVSDLTWDANPVAGQTITFRATVKNVGNVASPTGSLSVYLYTDVSSIAFAGTVLANTSIAAGGSTIFTIVPPASVVWSAGNQVITAWVDRNPNFWPNPTGAIAERSDLNNQTFKVLAVASSAVGSSFDSATVGQPPAGFTTSGDGWVVKSEAGQNFLENTTAGTGTRSITQAFPSAHSGSWVFDFKHTWRWGGWASTGNGFRTLSVSSDILDAAGNGVRIRAYQGNGGNAAYDGALVEIYVMTNGVAAATPIAAGGGFNRPGWKSVGKAAPDWRAMRVSFDRGTRKLTVLADLAGTGQYQRVAGAILTSAPATFSKYTLNVEGLSNSVAPEFDDLRMALLP